MRKALLLLLCGAFGAASGCGPRGHEDTSATQPPRPSIEARRGSAAAKARKAAHAQASAPELGRCHGDWCSWSITRSRTVVREGPAGALVRLRLLGGTSPNTDGDDPAVGIRWNARDHEVYVFCSTRLPAVIMKIDPPPGAARATAGRGQSPYQVDVLDFAGGIAGSFESSANLFVGTCYPHEDWTDPDFAARHGLEAPGEVPEVAIDMPEDIFQVADRMRR